MLVNIKFVGMQHGAYLDHFVNGSPQRRQLAVWHNLRPHLSTTLQHSHDYGLAVSALHATFISKTPTFRLVHVAGFATDESLIYFDMGVSATEFAAALLILQAKTDAGATELAKSLVADMETSEGRSVAQQGLKAELTGKSPAELKQQVIASLTRVGQILDAKAPADAAAFKAWLKHIAEQVAEAASEGGFLGIGGIKVTEAERASIGEVAQALRAR